MSGDNFQQYGCIVSLSAFELEVSISALLISFSMYDHGEPILCDSFILSKITECHLVCNIFEFSFLRIICESTCTNGIFAYHDQCLDCLDAEFDFTFLCSD
jgi:hypothetical protein